MEDGAIIYEYGKDPVNYGRIASPSFSYTEKNHTCGEYLTIDFVLHGTKVVQIGFEGDGRMVGIASMSLLSIELTGEDFSLVETFDKDLVLELLEVSTLTQKRMRSAMLPVLALKNAYRTFSKEEVLEFEDVLPEHDD